MTKYSVYNKITGKILFTGNYRECLTHIIRCEAAGYGTSESKLKLIIIKNK